MSKAKKNGFEEQLNRLQEITAQLEGGQVCLERSLELYKEGVRIAADCRKILENAKHTVQIYTKEGLAAFADPADESDTEGLNDF